MWVGFLRCGWVSMVLFDFLLHCGLFLLCVFFFGGVLLFFLLLLLLYLF